MVFVPTQKGAAMVFEEVGGDVGMSVGEREKKGGEVFAGFPGFGEREY